MNAETSNIYDRWIEDVVIETEKTRDILNSSPERLLSQFRPIDPSRELYEKMQKRGNDYAIAYLGHLIASVLEQYDYAIEKPEAIRNMGLRSKPIICERDNEKIGIVINSAESKAILEEYGLNRVYNALLFDEEEWPVGVCEPCPSCYSANIENVIGSLATSKEAARFRAYSNKLRKQLSNIYGFRTIAEPTSSQIEQFASSFTCDFATIFDNEIAPVLNHHNFTELEISLTKHRVVDSGLYKILLGHEAFAASFAASEWRYRNGYSFEGLEQTGTVVGYLKSIEQFFWWIFEIYANEPSGKKLSFKHFGPSSKRFTRYYYDGELHIESSGSSQEEQWKVFPLDATTLNRQKNRITLGTVEFFLRFRCLHQDLFTREFDKVDQCATGSFNSRLADLVKLFRDEARNDKLHKHNFEGKEEVEHIRNMSLAIISLALGSMEFGEKGRNLIERAKGGDGIDFFPADWVSHYLDALGRAPEYISYNSAQFFISRNELLENGWKISLSFRSKDSDRLGGPVNLCTSWRYNGEESKVHKILTDVLEQYVCQRTSAELPCFMRSEVIVSSKCGETLITNK